MNNYQLIQICYGLKILTYLTLGIHLITNHTDSLLWLTIGTFLLFVAIEAFIMKTYYKIRHKMLQGELE